MTPAISIVIPTYNGQKFLAETIDSVLQQSVDDWELVIVDDGSTDNTLALAQEYARRDARIRAVSKENGGESTARNRGYAEISPSTRYIIFLDHDDMWEIDALQILRAALEVEPDALGAYGIGQFVDEHGRPIMPGHLEAFCRVRKRLSNGQFVDCEPQHPTTFETISYHPSIPTPGVCLLRRSALPVGELFKPSLRTGSGDIHLWLRLARRGYFVFLNTHIIRGRRHADNMTNHGHKIDRSYRMAFQDVFISPETSRQQKRVLNLGYRHMWRDRSRAQLRSSGAMLRRSHLLHAAKEAARALRNYCRYLRGIPTRPLS